MICKKTLPWFFQTAMLKLGWIALSCRSVPGISLQGMPCWCCGECKPERVLTVDRGFRCWFCPAQCPEVFKDVGIFCSKYVSLLNPRGDQAPDKPLKAMTVSLFPEVLSRVCRLFWKILFNQMLTAELNTAVIEWNAMGCYSIDWWANRLCWP